jgi:hypothetical protein
MDHAGVRESPCACKRGPDAGLDGWARTQRADGDRLRVIIALQDLQRLANLQKERFAV